MTDPVVYINGRKTDFRKASISVFDYTLHCAIGLFESILAVDERLISPDKHLDRMESGLKRLGLKLNYNRVRINRTLRMMAAEHPARVKKAKVILTHGFSPLWPGSKPGPKTIAIITGHRLQFKKQKLIVSPMIITSANPMRGIKSVNFMTEWMSQYRAYQQGYDQGIIINQRGQIAETGSSSLFMVKSEKLYTPPISAGGLAGIMRQEVIRLARANKIACYEKKMTPDDLITADEIFTTSSFKLIWPVVQLKLDRVYKYNPGPLSRAFFNRLKANFLTGSYKDTL